MAIESTALTVISETAAKAVSAGAVAAVKVVKEIGKIKLGKEKTPIVMEYRHGVPRNLNEYSVEFINMDSFTITVYFKNSGSWQKRWRNGIVLYVEVYIDRAKCKFCDNYADADHFVLKKSFWLGDRRECKVTGERALSINQQKLSRLLFRTLKKETEAALRT